MSNKRTMEHQGGGERYGAHHADEAIDVGNGPADPPRQATAAQLAKRKIASMKGRTSGRNSRQGSPATGAPPVNTFAQNQTFQPPQSTGGGFNFSFGQSPSFGQTTEQQQPEQNAFGGNQNGGNAFGNTQNGAPIFSAGGAAPPRIKTVSTFAAQHQAEMGLDNFGPKNETMNIGPQDDELSVDIQKEFAHQNAVGRLNEIIAINSRYAPQKAPINAAPQNGWPFPSLPPLSEKRTIKPDLSTDVNISYANGEFKRQMQNGDSSHKWGQSDSANSKPDTPSFSFGATQPQQSAPAPPSSSFTFGSTQPQQPAQSTPSFSFGASQPQQPAHATPSLSFGATQPQTTEPAPSFSFGASQSTQATANASTPSFSGFGQNTQSTQDTAKTNTPSFGGFGQSSQANGTTTPSFGGFGQNAQSTQDNAKASTPSFGGFGQNTTSAQDTRASTPSFSGFGQSTQQNGSSTPSFFGASPAATPEPSTPGESVFSSVANKSNGIKQGMFTASHTNGEQTPKPATFSFGSSATANAEQTPKPQPTFSFGNTNAAQSPSQPSGFNFGQSQSAQQTPSAASLFSGGFGQPKETPKFSFGAPNGDDHNMDKSEEADAPAVETPSEGRSLFDQMTPRDPPATSSADAEAPSTADKSLFDRMTPKDPPATEPRPSFTSSMFGAKAGDQTPSNPSKSLFEPPATAPRPATSLFQSTEPTKEKEATPAPASLFAPAATPQTAKTAPTPAPSTSFSTPAPASKPKSTAAAVAVPQDLKNLNQGLLAHLKTQDTTKDWTPIFAYYMEQVTKLPSEDEHTPKPAAPVNIFAPKPAPAVPPVFSSQVTPKAPTTSNMFKHAQTPAVGSSLRNQITQSPPATAPVSRKRSADEDLTKDSDSSRAPATEKRSRPNEAVTYPKLPDTASNTARLFASALDKPTTDAPKFGPPADVVAKVREDAAKKADAEKGKETASPFSFKPSAPSSSGAGPAGFRPTFGAPTAGTGNAFSAFAQKAKAKEEEERKKRKDEDFDSEDDDEAEWEAKDKAAQEEKTRKIREAAQKAPGFVFAPQPTGDKQASKAPPTFGLKSATEDGLSAFAKKAKATEEKERRKRKDEDFDSDDDDEAEWEAKDKAAQAEKARKIREAAQKAPGFVFNPPTGGDKPASSIFAQTPAKTASTSSSVFGNKTPSSNIFGQSTTSESADKTEAEKEQGSGDHTWKPDTPIKFVSTAAGQGSTTPSAPPPANPFGGLFGSKTMTPAGAADKSKLGLPPKMGFNFGPATNSSLTTSRATTPGLTTDGEASTAGDDDSEEPSDQPKEAQVEDMTALLPEEKEGHDVLFQADICLVKKYADKKTEDGTKLAWVEKGKGPVYVLKEKSTGKVRILVKNAPLGRVAMNFTPIKDTPYTVRNKKYVFGAFVDHLDKTQKQGAPSSWTVQLKEPSQADELAKILMDGRPQ